MQSHVDISPFVGKGEMTRSCHDQMPVAQSGTLFTKHRAGANPGGPDVKETWHARIRQQCIWRMLAEATAWLA